MNDFAGFKDLFGRYYRPLCLYAIHYLKNVQAAEDAVQDVFVTYWERGVAADDPRAYLYRMTRNKCVDILRHGTLSDGNVQPEDVAEAITDE